jgi:hypothetical protein
VTKAGAAALPLGAVQKFIGIKEGDACIVDGADGTWQDGGDGFLYCRPRPMPTTRADAVPRTMDAATAQEIKDRAWREYVHDISNAWRS